MKMKKIFGLFLSIFMAGNCFAGDDWGQFAKYESANDSLVNTLKPGEIKAIFIGNSITEGWARIHPDFFKSNDFLGRGISGQTSYQMLLRFRDDVINLHPEFVIINAGTNDIAENNHNYKEERTFGNIVSMAELADANGIKVILSSVLPAQRFHWRESIKNAPEKIESLNKRIREYAEKKGYGYIDYHSAMKNETGGTKAELTRDGVHPNASGYDVMESIVLDCPSLK